MVSEDIAKQLRSVSRMALNELQFSMHLQINDGEVNERTPSADEDKQHLRIGGDGSVGRTRMGRGWETIYGPSGNPLLNVFKIRFQSHLEGDSLHVLEIIESSILASRIPGSDL